MSEAELGLKETGEYEILKKRLSRLVSRIPLSYVDNQELFEKNKQEITDRWKRAVEISETLRDLKSVTHQDDRLKSMSKMLAYLGLVESLGATIVDMVLIVLMINGEEVHSRGAYTHHIKSFEELRDLDLAFKLDFLKDEGFNFNEIINRNLRNDIAHLKFTISETGDIRTNNNPVDINLEITKFWDGVETFRRIFDSVEYFKMFDIKDDECKA